MEELTETKARAIVNSYLIVQDQVGALKRVVVNHKDLRNELIDALDRLNYDYMMSPAKVRDKSFQKPGEENYKTVWVFTLIREPKPDSSDIW